MNDTAKIRPGQQMVLVDPVVNDGRPTDVTYLRTEGDAVVVDLPGWGEFETFFAELFK